MQDHRTVIGANLQMLMGSNQWKCMSWIYGARWLHKLNFYFQPKSANYYNWYVSYWYFLACYLLKMQPFCMLDIIMHLRLDTYQKIWNKRKTLTNTQTNSELKLQVEVPYFKKPEKKRNQGQIITNWCTHQRFEEHPCCGSLCKLSTR